MMRVIIVVPASILAQSLACHWGEEVNRPHAYGLNGPWLIGQQTDDPNEWRERIKCLLSSPFILPPCPPFISPSFQRGGACTWGVFVGEEVGPFLAGCGNQWEYYY